MVFHQPFTVGFYEYKATDGVPRGLVNALLPVTLTLDIVTSPLQFLILCTDQKLLIAAGKRIHAVCPFTD